MSPSKLEDSRTKIIGAKFIGLFHSFQSPRDEEDEEGNADREEEDERKHQSIVLNFVTTDLLGEPFEA
jgi:hypothetical protein